MGQYKIVTSGYRTLSCVLPHQLMFCYKIPEIVEFSRRVLDAAMEHEMRSLVTHSISNNGATVYQHLLSSSSSCSGLEVRGAVFDSSPGPQTLLPLPVPALLQRERPRQR